MIDRDVYRSGRYTAMFQPDDSHNPFHALYAAKRADVLAGVRSHVERGGALLDLGGGPGRMAVPLAADYRVTLCDVSADMLQTAEAAARGQGLALSTTRLDAAEPLPFAGGTFAAAICTDVLPHLREPLSTLRELRRVLAPDGHLLVDTTNRSPWWMLRFPHGLGRRPGEWVSTWRGGGIAPEWQALVRHHSYGEFRALLSRAGFAVADEWRYGPFWCAKWFLIRCRPTS